MSKIIYTSLDASIKFFIFQLVTGTSFSFRFYSQTFPELNMLILKGKRWPLRYSEVKDKDG